MKENWMSLNQILGDEELMKLRVEGQMIRVEVLLPQNSFPVVKTYLIKNADNQWVLILVPDVPDAPELKED